MFYMNGLRIFERMSPSTTSRFPLLSLSLYKDLFDTVTAMCAVKQGSSCMADFVDFSRTCFDYSKANITLPANMQVADVLDALSLLCQAKPDGSKCGTIAIGERRRM